MSSVQDRPRGNADFRVASFAACTCLTALILPLLASRLAHPSLLAALVLTVLLGLLIVGVVLIRSDGDLAEPLYWFSLMYFLAVPASLYFIVSGFGGSEHLRPYPFVETVKLANEALFLLIIGYAAFAVGYFACIASGRTKSLRLPTTDQYAAWIARLVVATAIAIGTVNFIWLVSSYPGGVTGYLLNFGLRALRLQEIEGSVTTFGYQFLYAGVLLWYLVILRENKCSPRFLEYQAFVGTAAFSVLVSVSQGRMSQTVTYLLLLVFLIHRFAPISRSNVRLSLTVVAVGVLGIILYFYRKVSVALYLGKASSGPGDFLADLTYWLFDKGNVPNIPVIMNLLADRRIDGDPALGETYVRALASLSDAWGEVPNVGQTLGAAWFGQGGGLPPTVVGEAYVNFGFLGVPAVLAVVGAASALLFNAVRRHGEFIGYLAYFGVLFKFIFILPKGETANFAAAVWQVLPAILLYALVRLGSGAAGYGRQAFGSSR